jgi:GT2 family glycosyltransferase
MMDDDIQLTDSDSIKKMKQVLDSADDIGLCAGIIYQKNGEPFGGRAYSRGLILEIDNSVLFRHKSTGQLAKADGVLYNYADQVVNFFLAKRAIFKSVTWDNRIKIEYEHMDFFLNLKKTKWKVTVCLDAKATHDHQLQLDPLYVQHRFSAPVNYFYGKHEIGNIVNRYQQGVGG